MMQPRGWGSTAGHWSIIPKRGLVA
jgi:hypothetical protein